VEERQWHRRFKNAEVSRCDRSDVNVLVMAKRLGMSFNELDLLTMQDFVDMAYLYMGDDPDAPREATQEDIDAFYRG